MSHAGEYAFESRNQSNYAWWRPLAEIVAVAVLTVAFVAVFGVSLEAAGVDTTSGAADKYFGYGSVVVEILAVLAAVSVPPFLLAYAGLGGFVNALYFAGTFGGVLMGIIPILLLNAARRHGDQLPAFSCGWYAHPLIQGLIVLVFASSGVYAIASALGMLPASW